jgi:AcrR family transcriptional regulator
MTEPMRERLMRAAVGLFNKRGFRETTVGDIEAAAGLTRRAGGFYRHFASKEDVLVRSVESMATEMISAIRMADVVLLKAPRAELLVIARALLRHAEFYRPVRLLIQREGHKLPALRAAARRANAKLAALDVVPWVENVLARSGASAKCDTKARELGLIIFGPVLTYLVSLDRADPAFQLADDGFLDAWADHWAAWLARGGDQHRAKPKSRR